MYTLFHLILFKNSTLSCKIKQNLRIIFWSFVQMFWFNSCCGFNWLIETTTNELNRLKQLIYYFLTSYWFILSLKAWDFYNMRNNLYSNPFSSKTTCSCTNNLVLYEISHLRVFSIFCSTPTDRRTGRGENMKKR